MSVSHEMTEIREAMEDALDPRARQEHEESGKSRWNGYEKTLRTVERTAEPDAMRSLATWIRSQIRDREELPSVEEVREEGGRISTEMGYEVDPESWLNP